MNATELCADLAVAALLVAGISRFRTPRGARFGNHAAGLALLASIVLVLARTGVTAPAVVAVALATGALAGLAMAVRASMTNIPAVIAFQHGMGGVAAVLVSAIELTRGGVPATATMVSGLFGLVLGAATFSASLLAAAKLGNYIDQRPTASRWHNATLITLLLLVVLLADRYRFGADPILPVVGIVAIAAAFGALFASRIGGADMPVLISLLNATAGLAAAFCGVTIESRLLIVAGATVASSGAILTIMMCRAMNRSLANILLGAQVVRADPEQVAEAPVASAEPDPTTLEDRLDAVARVALDARRFLVVPGYGMALAQAQGEVVRLARFLETLGKEVRFAIHPVAGRMPGHMNVLLAEAEVDYEKLIELDDANRELPETDLVLVVGACDVVNPAALEVEGTPLSGMPILMAHQARAVAVCNLDENPGYSGVANPLYRSERTYLLLGDALETVTALHARITRGSVSV
ncbi:MAG: NAD(P)(+) transhydrogenase (Re/Si-specific) subunit beta [Deltaproteobacteria bacterium]|nr:NAD(P)(+) transhydrogenase (Re/Si-specific) subunit beta [Deltaproteobacteria bacterium]